jgi:hypothetical protein
MILVVEAMLFFEAGNKVIDDRYRFALELAEPFFDDLEILREFLRQVVKA